MVLDNKRVTSASIEKENSNDNKSNKVKENMNRIVCNDEEIRNAEEVDRSSKDYLDDEKENVNFMRTSNSNYWWPNSNDGAKLDSRQRWSFGSDVSIEATDISQSRLCCSPVDEFDSTVSSENEEIIVNNAVERDDAYNNYVQLSPRCSPTFKKVSCSNSDEKSKSEDVDTADDELIDYSKRYTTDTSMSIAVNKHIAIPQISRQQRNITNAVNRHASEKKTRSTSSRSEAGVYGNYAETDLDQPTDYSLRYAEEDTDEDEKEDSQFYCTEDQEDTVKTYYTEGTPYQTPCNFSTATSMSDLLAIEDPRGDDAVFKKQYLRDQKQELLDKPERIVKDCRNKIQKKYLVEDLKIVEKTKLSNDQKVCVRKQEKLLTPPQSPAELCDKDKESKTVTFNSEEQYAQETPLMFSRSSSLESLSEFDQHSFHDDHSSVISDFSHRTSGAVSPSELPDSPTQTVPPSPNRSKQQSFQNQVQLQKIPYKSIPIKTSIDHEQNNRVRLVEGLPQVNCTISQPCLNSNNIVKHCGVFEDNVIFFKDESISNKIHSTTASSLSSLTIDDDISECDNQEIMNKISAMRVKNSAAGMHQAPMQNLSYDNDLVHESDKTSLKHQIQVDNVLNRPNQGYRNNSMKCVSSVQERIPFVATKDDNNGPIFVNQDKANNKYRNSSNDFWYDNCQRNDTQNHLNQSPIKSPNPKCHIKVVSPQNTDSDEIITVDTTRIYCTEDTPTFISPFGSGSNLSALSMLSISDENIDYSLHFQEHDQPRSFYEDQRGSSRNEAYDTDSSSNFSDDDINVYDDRRIDVSPFDSQLNLDNFALLCIEEVSEEEDEEEINHETDKFGRKNSCDEDKYGRLSYDAIDYSDEDNKVLEDCIKSGMSKVTRRRGDDIDTK